MTEMKSFGARFAMLFVVVLAALAMALGASALPNQKAFAASEGVQNCASGVFKFNWSYNGNLEATGTAFLINDDTIVTAYHCTFPSDAYLSYWNLGGTDRQILRDNCSYSVTINRDVTVNCTLVTSSEQLDFAVLKLDQKINGRTPLTIRSSATVKAAEKCFSVGFPAASYTGQAIKTYTTSDVTFKEGTVSKPVSIFQGYTNSGFEINGNFLQTSLALSGGDSGGPLVDENGYVIGVSVISADEFCLGSAIDDLTAIFDDLGISYKKTDGNSSSTTSNSNTTKDEKFTLNTAKIDTAVSNAEALNSSDYTADSYKAVTEALAAAKTAKSGAVGKESPTASDQTAIDSAADNLNKAIDNLKKNEGLPVAAIAGIVIGVIVVIGIIVAVVLVSRKKKKDGSSSAAANAVPVVPPANGGGDDTIVLTDGGATGGSLTRISNNEQIPIAGSEFTIGRDRSKVDYALVGNGSVSRVHARLSVRGNKTYIADNNSANGTYVNGVKLRPGFETELRSGDVVTIAEEKFTFNR